MASSNPGPSMTDETNENVSMPSFDTLRLENVTSVREASGESDDNEFETFSFHSSNVISRGSYSTVFKGTFLSEKEVAIKRIQQTEAEIAEKEYKILLEASHPYYVINNMQIHKDKYFIYLVLEFCHTNLNDVVIQNMVYEYTIKVKLLFDIAFGLNHLHSKGIINRNLKPSNILIKQNSDTKKIIPKIADFGISRKLDEGKDHYTAGGLGTRIWCAPEVLDSSNRHITTSIDMFTYGCIVHFVMCPASKKSAP